MPRDTPRKPATEHRTRSASPATKLTPAQNEQRRAIRIIDHSLKITYDGCSEWVDVRSPDLSTKGLFINTPHAFRKGERLKLRFELQTGTRIQTVGEVRYCLPGIGVGVEFVHLDELARVAIQEYIDATMPK